MYVILSKRHIASYLCFRTTVSNTTSHNALTNDICTWQVSLAHIRCQRRGIGQQTYTNLSRQWSKQLLEWEQTRIFELRISSENRWDCLLRHRQRQVNSPAVVTPQALWQLDEKTSPKGANGDVLNLKPQPLCQNPQREKRWESEGKTLKRRGPTVVCPDREGHEG